MSEQPQPSSHLTWLRASYISIPITTWAYFISYPYVVSRRQYIDPFDIFHMTRIATIWQYVGSFLGIVALVFTIFLLGLLTLYWSERGDIATAPAGHGTPFAIVRLILRLLPFAIVSFLVFVVAWTLVRFSVMAYTLNSHPFIPRVPPTINAQIVLYGLVFNGVALIYLIFAFVASKSERQTAEGLVIVVCLLASLLAVSANADWWLSQSHAIFVVEHASLSPRGSVSAVVRPLSKIDASYFAVTTFTTLGLGDIRPTGGGGRLLVILQSVGNFAVIGLGLSLIFDKLHGSRDPNGSPRLTSKSP